MNWWSPKNKESGIKGRSLNLTQGVVESTENIYKYHMQISGSGNPGTRSPPAPLVQTPIGGTHSRSSSHASNQSSSLIAQSQSNAPAQVQGVHKADVVNVNSSEEINDKEAKTVDKDVSNEVQNNGTEVR